jgi:hypothetical protein
MRVSLRLSSEERLAVVHNTSGAQLFFTLDPSILQQLAH